MGSFVEEVSGLRRLRIDARPLLDRFDKNTELGVGARAQRVQPFAKSVPGGHVAAAEADHKVRTSDDSMRLDDFGSSFNDPNEITAQVRCQVSESDIGPALQARARTSPSDNGSISDDNAMLFKATHAGKARARRKPQAARQLLVCETGILRKHSENPTVNIIKTDRGLAHALTMAGATE